MNALILCRIFNEIGGLGCILVVTLRTVDMLTPPKGHEKGIDQKSFQIKEGSNAMYFLALLKLLSPVIADGFGMYLLTRCQKLIVWLLCCLEYGN